MSFGGGIVDFRSRPLAPQESSPAMAEIRMLRARNAALEKQIESLTLMGAALQQGSGNGSGSTTQVVMSAGTPSSTPPPRVIFQWMSGLMDLHSSLLLEWVSTSTHVWQRESENVIAGMVRSASLIPPATTKSLAKVNGVQPDSSAVISSLKDEVEVYRAKLREADMKSVAVERSLRREVEVYKTQIQQLQQQLNQSSRSPDDADQHSSTSPIGRQSHHDNDNAINNNHPLLEEAEREKRKFIVDLTTTRSELEQVRNHKSQLENEMMALTLWKEQFQPQLGRVQKRVEELESELRAQSNLKLRCEGLENELQEANAAISILEEEVRRNKETPLSSPVHVGEHPPLMPTPRPLPPPPPLELNSSSSSSMLHSQHNKKMTTPSMKTVTVLDTARTHDPTAATRVLLDLRSTVLASQEAALARAGGLEERAIFAGRRLEALEREYNVRSFECHRSEQRLLWVQEACSRFEILWDVQSQFVNELSRMWSLRS